MEDRETMILHWMDIAAAVFKAEDEISDEWFPKLRATKDATKEEKARIADEYLRAIATEIVCNYSETE